MTVAAIPYTLRNCAVGLRMPVEEPEAPCGWPGRPVLHVPCATPPTALTHGHIPSDPRLQSEPGQSHQLDRDAGTFRYRTSD